MKKLIFIVLIATSILFAEEKKTETPKKQMSETEFVEIYVDLSLAAEKFLANQDSVAHSAKMDSIFTNAGYTKVQWEEFRKGKNADPEGWQKIYDKIIERITALQKEEETK